jgi:hypothetical protein
MKREEETCPAKPLLFLLCCFEKWSLPWIFLQYLDSERNGQTDRNQISGERCQSLLCNDWQVLSEHSTDKQNRVRVNSLESPASTPLQSPMTCVTSWEMPERSEVTSISISRWSWITRDSYHSSVILVLVLPPSFWNKSEMSRLQHKDPVTESERKCRGERRSIVLQLNCMHRLFQLFWRQYLEQSSFSLDPETHSFAFMFRLSCIIFLSHEIPLISHFVSPLFVSSISTASVTNLTKGASEAFFMWRWLQIVSPSFLFILL